MAPPLLTEGERAEIRARLNDLSRLGVRVKWSSQRREIRCEASGFVHCFEACEIRDLRRFLAALCIGVSAGIDYEQEQSALESAPSIPTASDTYTDALISTNFIGQA